MSSLLVLAWLVPLLAAPASLSRFLWWTPAVGALPALAAALWLSPGVTLEVPWLLMGSRLGLDETGRLFLAFTAVLWLAAGLYAAHSLKGTPHGGRFRTYFLLAMAGNLWLILAQDLVSFYTGFALMGLASYGLVVHHGDRQALKAGRVYLAMTLIAELALFCALVLIAAQTGTLTPSPEQLTDLRDLTIALLLFGLAIKAGLVPLHVWLPLAHPAAPVPASAVLSGTMIKVALLGWLRFLPVGQVALPEWGLLLLFVGLITLFFAIPVGLVQSDPKVILAYSSVSKMGFLTLILGLILLEPALAPGGILALTLYAAHHALAKGGLFLGVGLRHHAAVQPLVLLGLTLLALSMAGTPASGGAVAKYGLKTVLSDPGWSWLGAAVSLGAIATVFLMARFLWVMGRTAPHPAPGYGWGGAAWGLLVLLVVAYPLLYPYLDPEVLGAPTPWLSGSGPIAIGIGLSGLMALVAWRKPRLLRPLAGKVSPGDILILVRPILAVFLLLWRVLWRGWMRLFRGTQARLQGMLARLGQAPQDPERPMRAWPNVGSAWLGITALLLALLLGGPPQGPLPDAAPELATVAATDASTPLAGEVIAEAPAIPAGPQGSAQGSSEGAIEPPSAIPAPATVTAHEPLPEIEARPEPTPAPGAAAAPIASPSTEAAVPGTGVTEPSGTPQEAEAEIAKRAPPEPREPEPDSAAPGSASAGTRRETDAECDPAEVFVLRHPAVSQPLELTPCILDQGIPQRVPAPTLSNRLVELVQHHLNDLGYAPGPLDGLIGPRTLDAIRRFQRDQGLAATGVLSFDLLERIQSARLREKN
jgi:formate hydrogenlyase subunit 3/multisubunit Na+/H+ antiporter MnhD subunit